MNANQNSLSCQICNRKGHIARNCYSFINKRNFNKNSNYKNYSSSNIQQASNFNENKYVNNSVQTECNKSFNPMLSSTPKFNSKSIRCFYCKNFGHSINNCRKREFNNQFKQSSSVSSANSANVKIVSENSNVLDQVESNAVVRAQNI